MKQADSAIVIWVRHLQQGWQKHTVSVLSDGYQDVKTKEQFLFSRGVEVNTHQPDVCPGVYMDGSHTCIVVKRTDTHTSFVPMASLEVTKVANGVFDSDWHYNAQYPVRRAAQVYIGAGEYRPIPDKTRELLSEIAADPATSYPPFANQPEGTEKMATATKKASEKKAAAPAKNGVETVVKGAKAVAAKKAPWDKNGAKAEPAPAPAKKTAAPAKTVAAKAPAAAKKPAVSGDVAHKVADDSKVKRGFLRDYVDAAKDMQKAGKSFNRDQLVNKFKAQQDEERLVRYFAYCTGNGIFAPAK